MGNEATAGYLGLGEPLEEGNRQKLVPVGARIFNKHPWDQIAEDEAHVIVVLVDGRTTRIPVRLTSSTAHYCDFICRSKAGEVQGTVTELLLIVENLHVATWSFKAIVGSGQIVEAQFRVARTGELV